MFTIFIYFLVINLVGFFLIWYDKKMAIAQKYRIAEKTLLSIVAFGGVIGSGLAIFGFRHKIAKKSFLYSFYGIAIVQILIVLYYLKNYYS
ncbi:DUF1294 domain-containing protein [Flavobacterium sp.]|uniref:DUF1294 domain-containing protein n=1 Tax=Flavobacterium sp. TaxID=239 RepID=UPI00286E1AA0|nr:DUF1294 domain-containing protein [Flavobacterium sp.]